jgi:hypothetical protein
MDALSILGAAVCMIGMCAVMMWAMMRMGGRKKSDDPHRSGRTGHTA